jgi:uncharacterized sodium:solute symporter family permease YidK
MVVICLTFIPIYHKYKVYTAYEYLEKIWFKNAFLAAILFLFQRGLGTGITIYAPAIILSAILGWNLNYMTIAIGVLVIIYTFQGDKSGKRTKNSKCSWLWYVDHFFFILTFCPMKWHLAMLCILPGQTTRWISIFPLILRNTPFEWITGGFFLALAYFGTDQSQVGRYLSGRSVRESQMGLIMNGL